MVMLHVGFNPNISKVKSTLYTITNSTSVVTCTLELFNTMNLSINFSIFKLKSGILEF